MLKFQINDYHAIKEADIEIGGITTLAGPNSSGKSTLARWIYYYLNISNKFDLLMTNQVRSYIWNMIRNTSMLFSSHDYQQGRDLCANLEKYITKFSLDDKTFIYEAYGKLMDTLRQCLLGMPTNERVRVYIHPRWGRYFKQLETTHKIVSRSPWNKKVDMLIELLTNSLMEFVEQTDEAALKRSVKDLRQIISSEYLDSQSFPEYLKISEDGVLLLNESTFKASSFFDNVCYVDTPFATTVEASRNHIWDEFQSMLLRENVDISAGARMVLKNIQAQTSVKVTAERDTLGFEKALYFYEKGKKMLLSQAATGIKSFAYISRLLENGTLNDHTLLLIDEPEAHLHPQWIVEFARVLVWLQKYVGVTIVIASHNPDMVSAIHSIAAKEEIMDKTCFYLAEREDVSSQFVFRNKGQEIGDIFTSFNIALSRIEQYGCDCDNL